MKIDYYLSTDPPAVRFVSPGRPDQKFEAVTVRDLLAAVCESHAHLLGNVYQIRSENKCLRQELGGLHV